MIDAATRVASCVATSIRVAACASRSCSRARPSTRISKVATGSPPLRAFLGDLVGQRGDEGDPVPGDQRQSLDPVRVEAVPLQPPPVRERLVPQLLLQRVRRGQRGGLVEARETRPYAFPGPEGDSGSSAWSGDGADGIRTLRAGASSSSSFAESAAISSSSNVTSVLGSAHGRAVVVPSPLSIGSGS